MKINHIKISNILGIEALEFSPAGWTAVTGGNGTGKTSVLNAIKASIEGGQDATLLRKGQEKGEVVLVLDDGTTISRRISQSRSVTSVTDGLGRIIPKPAEAIKALTDSIGVNPVAFLTASTKDRASILLESMPIELDFAKLSEIAGHNIAKPTGQYDGLELVNKLRAEIFTERTSTNRAVKEKTATINQLTDALPAATGGENGHDESALAEELSKNKGALQFELDRIANKLNKINEAHQGKIDAIRKEGSEAIDKIKLDMQAKMEAAHIELARIKELADKQRDKAKTQAVEKCSPIEEQLNYIRRNRDAVAKRAQSVQIIARMTEQLGELNSDAEKQSEAISGLDAYKAELLGALPIDGLTINNGIVELNGITFDRLNTAKQIEIAFQIATLRSGALSVCCLDGLELLDSTQLAELERQAAVSKMQVFVTRVTDSDFAIETQ